MSRFLSTPGPLGLGNYIGASGCLSHVAVILQEQGRFRLGERGTMRDGELLLAPYFEVIAMKRSMIAGLLLTTLSGALIFPSPANATSYRAVKLGTLGAIGTSVAYGINASGQVVGYSSTASADLHAFVTGPDGVGMTDLGTLEGPSGFYSSAQGINASGQVVGWSGVPGARLEAFITGPNGVGMTDLGNLGSVGSLAYGINASGQVAGWSATASPNEARAFITGSNGVGLVNLGTLGGSDSYAYGLNANGQVVGQSTTASGASHAFITGPDGVGMTDLGTLGGSVSIAKGINATGQVVGSSDTTSGYDHAFITGPDGVGMTDLGTLTGNSSYAYGISMTGQVVGNFITTGGAYHAFITGPDGVRITDLNNLVSLSGGDYFTLAAGINDAGQIIANTYRGSAYLLTPVPEPDTYALMLAGLGLLGLLATRHKCTVA